MESHLHPAAVIYVVRVANAYLSLCQGDVGYAPALDGAGQFASREDAFDTAFEGYNLEPDQFEIFPARRVKGKLALLPINEMEE